MHGLGKGHGNITIRLDDICVTRPTKEIHLSRLQEVCKRLNESGLCLQKNKCENTYLGYVIDSNGLKHVQTKSRLLLKRRLENILGVKRFPGVVNYYRNFIPNASAVLSRLHELLHTGVEWKWSERQQAAFDNIKRELAS